MKHIKLFEHFINEKYVLDLKKVHKEIMNHVDNIDGTTIRKGNKITGIKHLEVHSDWLGSFMVDNTGDIWTNDVASSLGGIVKSEKELYKFITDEINDRIKKRRKN